MLPNARKAGKIVLQTFYVNAYKHVDKVYYHILRAEGTLDYKVHFGFLGASCSSFIHKAH